MIEIIGANAHNLRSVNLSIPRNKLVVFTGLSGSGKSSLAFDTIYAEGQRRYMESFSAYARQFIGGLERPDVEKITGLSPVISIEQKTTNKNPRSTVGTITEIYDFLRLLFARTATAYSYNSGKPMVRYTSEKIFSMITDTYQSRRIMLLAPMIKRRKGHYRELFDRLFKIGYLRVRIDGKIAELTPTIKLDRYKTHDIEVVIDSITLKEKSINRVKKSIDTALQLGKGSVMVLDEENQKITHYSKNLMCPDTGIAYEDPEPNSFSFNSPYGACPDCNGLGEVPQIAISKIFPDTSLSINNGGIAPIGTKQNNWIFKQMEAIGIRYNFSLDDPISSVPEEAIDAIINGQNEGFQVTQEFNGIINKYSLNFEGIASFLLKQYKEADSKTIQKFTGNYIQHSPCPSCGGYRLKKESLCFKINELHIGQYTKMDITEFYQSIQQLEHIFTGQNKIIAKEILREISTRTSFLLDVGLGYLSLNRSLRTLSGGESQRIRLATQIGSQLMGVLYILDEPSIGLHQRDNQLLIKSLKALRDLGNSIIVVEHDEEIIMQSDYIVDIGPGAGRLGGEIVACGTPKKLLKAATLTADYLSGRKKIALPLQRRKGNKKTVRIEGASGHNLRDVSLTIPLGKLICITGVSGSGKSSLLNHTLYPILNNYFYHGSMVPLPYKKISGLENIDKVIEINQSPIGRTPRSNPATYTKAFDEIRKLFVMLPQAKIRGYKPGRFSFNVKGGRCETCLGAGMKTIEMNFLPDVFVECDECYGKRYNRETLEVRYKGKSINDVLNLTINQAVDFFDKIPKIRQKVKMLQKVGLGYVTLGQSSTTLSGGEAQRIKLATELSKKDTGKTLYILDEPTTGLHFEDVKVLMEVLNQLVDKGNTIIVIEHNLDVIKQADFVVDMGPEGGKHGGMIITTGTPEEVAQNSSSITASYLKRVVK